MNDDNYNRLILEYLIIQKRADAGAAKYTRDHRQALAAAACVGLNNKYRMIIKYPDMLYSNKKTHRQTLAAAALVQVLYSDFILAHFLF
jgi:hypothetical protein